MKENQILLDILCEVSNCFTDIHDISDSLKEIVYHLRYIDESCNGVYNSSSALCVICPYRYKCMIECYEEKNAQY